MSLDVVVVRFLTKLLHCALASGAVYCNHSCLCVCGGRTGGLAVSVTTITRNCVHQSSSNWVCRCR